MAKNHVWRIKKTYFHQLESGDKHLEIRVGYPQIKKVRENDTISFENYGKNKFLVKRIAVYDSFQRMLEVEGVEQVLPGMTFNGAIRALKSIYPPEREALGIYAFELENLNHPHLTYDFWQASTLLKNGENKKFAKLVAEGYAMTDWISKDYPLHCEHYFCKYIPGIYDGEREIIACYFNNKIVGVAILKKDKIEQKISTLYVKEEYRNLGVATELLERSFVWLGTTKPLITIADYKLSQFSGIIQKYGWAQTQTLDKGFYNDHSQEYVFNGNL